MGNNIVLIGMPASGKSTVGVILAKLLACDFIDTDLLIQRREGMPLSEIIGRRGIDGFIGVEAAVCRGLRAERTVIATGGSVVYSPEAMAHLRALGRVVLLDVPREALLRRLTDAKGRGVVLRPGQTVGQLYDERMPLYRKYADITVPEGEGTLEDTVAAVIEKIRRV